MDLLASLALGVVVFVSTDIDDLFVLMGFFADPRMHPSSVVIGQYLGIAALIGVSFAISMGSLVIDTAYVGLLGVLPVLIGGKGLSHRLRGEGDECNAPGIGIGGLPQVLSVAAVTIANGGDNIGTYAPLFAIQSRVHCSRFGRNALDDCGLAVDRTLVGEPSQRWCADPPIQRPIRAVRPYHARGLHSLARREPGLLLALSWPPHTRART